jgi:hypothetical protein
LLQVRRERPVSAESIVPDLKTLSDYIGELVPKLSGVRFLLLEARERLLEKDQVIESLRSEVRGLRKRLDGTEGKRS